MTKTIQLMSNVNWNTRGGLERCEGSRIGKAIVFSIGPLQKPPGAYLQKCDGCLEERAYSEAGGLFEDLKYLLHSSFDLCSPLLIKGSFAQQQIDTFCVLTELERKKIAKEKRAVHNGSSGNQASGPESCHIQEITENNNIRVT